jgi:hypothetical protein
LTSKVRDPRSVCSEKSLLNQWAKIGIGTLSNVSAVRLHTVGTVMLALQLNNTVFPMWAESFAASRMRIAVIFSPSADKSPGATLIVPRTTAAR